MGFVIQYKTIFKVSVWHHHFLDSPLDPGDGGGDFVPPPIGNPSDVVERLLDYDLNRIIDLRLSPDSEKTVRNKGLIFKKTGSGCLLSSKNGFTETDPASKLTLLLSTRDAQFMSYSDFGFSKFENKVLYMSNFDLAAPALKISDDSVTNLLHATVDDDGRVERSSRVVRLPKLNAADGDATVQVFDLHTNPVQLVLTLTAKSEPGQTSYELDCRSLREGLYRFDSPAVASGTLRYLGLENESRLLAVVELYLKNLNDAHYQLEINKQ